MPSALASPLDPAATFAAPAPATPPAQPKIDQSNFNAAVSAMQLTPQEKALYQMHLTNLYGPGGVDNLDGTRSTLFQTTVEIEGKTYVLPTVWNGQIVPPDQAIKFAEQYGLDKFPAYASDDEAEARYQQMHGFMEKDTQAYQSGRR